ncbi:MAG: hypothetical protein ACD_20C00337G0034 [uncultured bacterium]|nr:MAG: hypothetical protein ACD_20C00337G0034 [uncultured bacterium]HBH18346.1 hypothetical protein [Cyanobacteria bacterium UBA9579]
MKEFLLKENSYRFYLIVAILLGVWFRFYGLDIQSLWFDELVTTAYASYSKVINVIGHSLIVDIHPPLYHVFIYYWIKVFGNSEISYRLPSAIAGILAIFFMYFGSKKLFNNHIATSATILIALSGSAIYYSQEARSYSLLLLFSVISTLLWLGMIKDIRQCKIKRNELLIYGVIGIITSYLHYFGFAIIFFQLLYLFIASLVLRNNVKRVLSLGFMIMLPFLLWFLPHFMYIKGITGGNFWIKNNWLEFFISFLNLVFNKYIAILIFIPFLINYKSQIKGLLHNIKSLKVDSISLSLLYLSCFPLIVFLFISLHTPILVPRYFIILLPSIYLLIAIFISTVPYFNGAKANAYVLAISLVGVIAFLSPINGNEYRFYYDLYKSDWRAASQYVVNNLDENSIIVVNKYPRTYRHYFDKLGRKDLTIKSLNDPDMRFVDIMKICDKVLFALESEFPKGFELQLQKDCKVYSKKVFIGNLFVYECAFNK